MMKWVKFVNRAPLLFVTRNDTFRGALNYQILTRSLETNSALLWRADAVFDRFGIAEEITKFCLSTELHQVRMKLGKD